MSKSMPVVSDGRLWPAQSNLSSFALDSPAWFAWLEQPDTLAFAVAICPRHLGYINGFVTFRKEPRLRGHLYWTADRRRGHRVRKRYVGLSSRLTSALLAQVAADLDT